MAGVIVPLICMAFEVVAINIGAHSFANEWRRNEEQNASNPWFLQFELESGKTLWENRFMGAAAGFVFGLVPVCLVLFPSIEMGFVR
jgi:hypothetical protein